MNVAVAAGSPLAQYLAELDEDSSATAGLASPTPRVVDVLPDKQRNARATLLPRNAIRNQTRMRCGLLFASAQLFASNSLLVKLSTYNTFGNLDERVFESGLLSDVVPATLRWWTPQALGHLSSGAAFATAAVTVVLATVVAPARDPSNASAYAFLWRVLGSVFVVAIAVEVFYQLLLARYSYAALQLENALQLYLSALGDVQDAFRLGLDVVKRSELAVRGYRLGRILPPVGRLEEASSARDPHFELQCRRLRIRLRDMNDTIEQMGRAVASRSLLPHEAIHTTATRSSELVKKEDNRPDDRATPSLLVTALAKRHELSLLLLENALRDTLVEDLASQLQHVRTGSLDQSFLSTVTAHTRTYRSLTKLMRKVANEVSRYITRLDRTSVLNSTFDKDSAIKNAPEASFLPAEVAAVSRALAELQASGETLRMLALTSQHDIECYGGTHEAEKRLRERLARSRSQMENVIQQLGNDWESLERAIRAAKPSETPCVSGTENTSDEMVMVGRGTSGEDKQRAMEIQRVTQQNAERDCLLVFTATSTGEQDFDLQSLLRFQQQQRLGAGAVPAPSFVGELQAVLGRREALPSAPIVEKRIGDDGQSAEESLFSSMDASLMAAQLPAPPRTIDLQQLLHSRFTAQLTEECFGGAEDDTEDVAADRE